MCDVCVYFLFFSSRSRHTRSTLVTGVQTCALPSARPVGKEKDKNSVSDTRYEDAINACLAHFEMKWPSLIAYRGIDRRGKTRSQMEVALQTLSLTGASGKTPTAKGMRPVLDHIRHQWTRKPWFNPRARAILGNSP